jgi:RNA polymerase sigma-70 factor (ECF subfamily)
LNEAPRIFLQEQLAQARAGEPAALTALILAHQRLVYSLALRMLGTQDLAEDLTQDVFMQLHASLQSIESPGHLTFWLRKVTAHRAIDQLRHRGRLEMTPLQDEHLGNGVEDGGDPLLQRHLRRLLLDLAAPARAVVVLHFQEDLDPSEIARTLGMSVNTVKSHLRRSLETLRERTIQP